MKTCGESPSQVSTVQPGEPGAGQPPCRGFGARSPKNIGARDVGRETNAGTAPVNLGDRFGASSTVDLRITNDASSQVTWSLAGIGGTPTGLKFNVYDALCKSARKTLARGACRFHAPPFFVCVYPCFPKKQTYFFFGVLDDSEEDSERPSAESIAAPGTDAGPFCAAFLRSSR